MNNKSNIATKNDDKFGVRVNLTFWSGVGTVTGANFVLEDNKNKIAIDCGLIQGTDEAEKENYKDFPYDPSELNYLFITHSHMDHIGRVPKLVKDGFRGIIYSTVETRELAEVMLADAFKVMSGNVSKGLLDSTLYDERDITKAFSLWQTIPYHTEKELNSGISVYVWDAGHILGSAMYEFRYDGKKILFTGDSGNSPAPLLKDTDKLKGINYLVMDSVYGDRNHEPKDERDEKFKRVVLETIEKKGTLVIPAFSLERTQVILYELNNLIEENKIPSVPVFLDSPLGSKVTEIYSKFTKDFNSEVRAEIKSGDNIFNFPKLHITHSSFDSRKILDIPNPKIIISSSGMSEGGRVLKHEADFLPDPNSTILLMGYQAIGTLGREIQNKPKEVYINGEVVPVRARIEMITGYSSHKDLDNLVEMVSDTAETLKKVFVVMGEPKTSAFLAQRLHEYLDVEAIYPERGKKYILD